MTRSDTIAARASGSHAPSVASTYAISPVDDLTEWDRLVATTEAATFAHLGRWRDVMESFGGHENRYRVARDETGRLAGVLPLVRLRSRLFGQHLVSLPFLNYGGPVGDPGARQALTMDVLSQASTLGMDTVALRARHAIDGFPSAARKVTVLLDLAPTVDEMWQGRFNAKLRTKIKRPMRDRMETCFGLDQLDAYYEVWSHNMRDLGTPVLPRAFFERIVAAFPDLVMIGATRFAGRPVAAGFGFVWRDEFEMTWSSALSEFGAAKPNMLLYWDFMRELISRGIRTFNFGRSTPGSGPHDFKRAWGGMDVALPWFEWPAREADGTRNSNVMRLAVAFWQRLPIAIANRLGPVVSPHLPWW